jgi:hypothetical protein
MPVIFSRNAYLADMMKSTEKISVLASIVLNFLFSVN